MEKFHGTNFRKLEAEKQIKASLINNNIVVSSLISWASDFSKINLVDLSSIKGVVRVINLTSKQV